jgi:NTP pyrophosphatase (non-canonical NTP hydrolase)
MNLINDAIFLNAIADELHSAREKFPDSKLSMTALTEEVGELAKALLEHRLGQASVQQIWDEAVQVAVMALRVAVEGDSSLGYCGRADIVNRCGDL